MNLRARFLGLITLSALTLFSCEEDISTLGLPPENNLGIFFADIPLGDYTSQVWIDGVNTRGSGFMLAGGYQDPNFGVIETGSYAEVDKSSTTFNNAIYDSVQLELRIASVYGNQLEAAINTLEVYQLTDTIQFVENGKLKEFTASSSEPLGSKIGEFSFKLELDSIGLNFDDTGIDLNDSINDTADSIFYNSNFDSNNIYVYKHQIKLDDGFGQAIFDELKTNQYDSAAETADLFKGIHLKSSSASGAIISYILDSYTNVVFYYTEGGEQKQARYSLASTRSYNSISPNKNNGWSGSDFDDLTTFYQSYETTNGLAYCMSGTNLLTKIDLSNFVKSMQDTVPDAIVQSAEFRIGPINSQPNLSPPSQLRLWLTSKDSLNNKNYRVLYPANASNNSVVTTTYDDGNKTYKLEVPLFLETLLSSNGFEYDQLIIAPASSNGSIPQSSIRRLVFDKANIRFRIYYTTPNKSK